ncbi:nitroreductase family protein [Micromonospora cathayae]|uniref:Nitroreductase family protein n=1 Tax=Micromonospora cathayae TaxID=3028804 RepID=A0ABY7ZL50_9ACTN|nr:nitroreductase family protein [Micromonospora sp. HUAS 3]WDZ83691.1 nitroreductase family protein [Micromonospora sp. HUAS 3]
MTLPFTDLNHVLTTTRSVRLRLDLDRPVPIGVVGECLQLALQAPTGGAAEDWRWVVVGDPTLRAELGKLYHAAYLEHVHAPLHSAAGAESSTVKGRLGGVDADGAVSPRTARILRGAEHLANTIGRAPYLVIPCATRPNPATGGPGTNSAVYGSLYPAIWQFNLALRARGLGTVITTLHLHHAARAAELLGIPDDALQITMLPVAYTVGTDFRPAARRPVNAVAYLDRWGTPLPYQDKPVDRLTGEDPG